MIMLSLTLVPETVFTQQESDPLCGPKSLLKICQLLEVPATLDELCELSKYDEKTGTNMLTLYKAAIAKGLNVTPMQLSLKQLCDSESYAIAHTDDNHFLIILKCSSEDVAINDMGKIYSLKKDDFNKIWKGNALVFIKGANKELNNKTSKVEGPIIDFEYKLHDYGEVEKGDVISHSFTFKNTGTDTLEIREVRSLCSCLKTYIPENYYPPGEMGNIEITFDTKSVSKGFNAKKIYVQSNDPIEPILELALMANIRTPVYIFPERLLLDNIPMNEEIEREVILRDDYERLKIERISVPEGIKSEILPSITENGVLKIPIKLTIKSSDNPISFKKQITIYTNIENQPEIIIPIQGNIINNFKVIPPQILFTSVDAGTTVTKEITLTNKSGKKVKLTEITSSSENVKIEKTSIDNGSRYELKVTLNAPQEEITIKYNLNISIEGEKNSVITIPLYARIVNGHKQ